MSDENVDLLPGWRRAYRALVDGEMLTPSSTITHAWLDEQLGIAIDPSMRFEDGKRQELKRLQLTSRLAEELRSKQQRELERDQHTGDMIVMAAQRQIDKATARFGVEVRREFHRAIRSLTHVDTLQLTDAQRARHTEALTHMQHMRSIARRDVKRLPRITDESTKEGED